MADDKRAVLVMATSREDRRVLFDVLDGMHVGEILSARDAAQARALLDQAPDPLLAILDFEFAQSAALALCAELTRVPVIGLSGVDCCVRGELQRAECANLRGWLHAPVVADEAAAGIREILGGTATPVRPAGQGATQALPLPAREAAVPMTLLQTLASLLQPDRDPAGLPGLVQRALDVLGMDTLMIAERSASGERLEPLARAELVSTPGSTDVLCQPFVQRALAGEIVVGGDAVPADAGVAAFLRATGCTSCAALPLFDARRNVLGVLVCTARRSDAAAGKVSQPLLEIVATRFAALLELRNERERGRSRGLLDGLTGLPNRALFHDRLESTLHDARRTGEVFAVLFVDLDRFKSINDSLGHVVGDQVLVALARRLCGAVRASDTVARYAGDEFTLILRHVNDRGAITRVAAKLLKAMQAPLALDDGSEMHVTASLGVSVYPDDAADAEGLVKHADMAMYSAKGQGRNKVQAFGNVPEDTHRQRLEMESRLRAAEANGELCVHYQPQLDLANGAVVAVEALVRWRHPVLGMLSPAFFIPLAEETGLIISIGEWVLRHACTDVAVWRHRSGLPLRLAVNLSALQWLQPNLVAMIEAACRDAGLDPSVLDLETPESSLANPGAGLVAALGTLRRLGCRIVIDDAGTGHALRDPGLDPPVDAIKVDHLFVRNIGSDPDDEAAVAAVLDAARRKGVQAIAEGVETERQLGFLRERGCPTAQGYLFCRPLAADALTDWLATRDAVPTVAAETPVMVTGTQPAVTAAGNGCHWPPSAGAMRLPDEA